MKTVKKRVFAPRLIAQVCTSLGIVGCIVAALNNLAGIQTWVEADHFWKHKKVPALAGSAVSAPTSAPEIATTRPAGLSKTQSASATPLAQESLGAQSPNVNEARHGVDIRYGALPALRQGAGAPVPVAAQSHTVEGGGVLQSSTGSQSPNINDVTGVVQLDYGATATTDAPKK